ncbi:MAG: HYR domain-containing protein [Bacteroidetes bacterium]|nr:HYR domain-containing protein [Bacteroidota bacterium]
MRAYSPFRIPSTAISISSITSTGTNAAEFVVTGAPTTVAAGGSATFTVTFTPTAAGLRTATITVNNDDCTEAAYDFAVQGTGIIPAPTLGTYANTSLQAGRNTTITPSAAPTNTTSIVAYTNTNFTGVLHVNPATGVVRITDAKQGGTYTVTVRADGVGGSTTTTFTLTVTDPACSQGLFANGTTVGVATNPYSVAIGDFNNDGIQDFAAANQSPNTVSIRLGNGSGGFTGTTNVGVGVDPYSVVVGDFNGDGNQDFACASPSNTPQVAIRMGDGLGGFASLPHVPLNGARNVALGDFNNDGKQDLAIGTTTGVIGIRLGDGNGGFTGSTNIAVGPNPLFTAIGDFNGDGNQDFATANSGTNTVSIRLGNGSGGFTGTTNVTVGTAPSGVAIGDFNEDGFQDFAAPNFGSNSVSIRFGDGTGNFTGATEIAVGTGPRNVAVGDFNGDGNQDIAVSNAAAGTVSVLYGNGAGVFATTTTFAAGTAPYGIAVGDFNADNKQDMLISNSNALTVQVRLGGENDINLVGNSVSIVDGDVSPALGDHTDFGTVNVGSPFARTYTINNTGTTALTVNAIAMGGADAGLFAVSGITLPATVAAAGSTTFTVTFTPASIGLKTATVNVLSDDCNEATYDFAVQGTARLPHLYVDLTAVGANNGTSWANAYTDLQNALAAAVSGDTIFVAAGTYKPDLAGPGNRNLSFGMKTGVVVLGGFPTGGGTLAQRNWVTNPTILSGDIGTQGVHTDNSYHVVRCNGQQGELNGFIVERGRADGAAPDNDGGGVFVTSGYVASRFCTFRNNFAADQGGGSYHDAGGNPTFRQCKFESNSAAFGGGSYAFASTVIANCGYVGNTATTNGGGVYAVVNINMYNATFKGNSATTSGNAIYYQSGGSNRLFNSIVWGNTGSGTHIAGAGSITLRSCIIEGGCPGGGATCTSILNVNPQFSDVAGHLASNSPAIDAGENTTGDGNSDALTIDLDNLNRNFDAIPGGVTRDMGAYESQALNLSRYYVDHTATGANDGTSWANAFTAFQSAVAIASAGDTVFVAAGTHKPSVGPGYSRTRKFTLVEGVRYYGGFPNGGGTFAQRDFSANRTILSGDIGNAIDSTDNCFTVVDASNLTPATLMSGFTVEEGNADSANVFVIYGRAGGINLAATGSIRLDSVTVRNNYGKTGAGIDGRQPTNWVLRGCTFDNNSNAGAILIEGNATGSMSNCIFTNNVGGVGGAINLNVLTANFTFTNCTFANNRATGGGGGGAISGGNGGCTFTNCSFTNNTATNGPGGAFYKFYSTLNTFNNCTFTGNRAAGGGGAIYGQGGFNLSRCEFRQNLVTTSSNHGGAMYNNGTASTIENCVFWDNRTTSGLGGAIYNNTGGTLTIRNTTFANNHALGFTQGGGINNNSSSNATINNSIFWGNLANNNDVPANSEIGHGSGTLTVTNSIWQGQTPSGTIYNINPLFTNQGSGDLTLTLCSPAIDTGSTAGMPVVDFLGNTRPFNAKPGTLDYDLGAYEFQASAIDVTPPNAICQNVTVNLNAGGNGTTTAAAVNNGSTDNCAITSLVLNTTAFTCANVGANTVTLTLSDAAGNTSSCNATVTVQDVTPPTALCQNVTVSLDGAGTASLTGAMLNNGSSDICGIASLNPSVTSFTCNNLNTSKLFISDADRVFKTDLLGNNRTNLNPLAAALYTLAVVPSKDSVYIANFNQGKLQRVHLNGGTVTDIKTGVQPFGIAVDHLAGKIYWADPNANTISRCNLDGSGTQIIVSGATDADYSRIIKLDLTNGKMYWTDANLGTVKRANLDGSSIQTIVTGQGNIVGLDLDVAANKLYFSSYSFSQIKRTNLDGTGLTVIVPAAGSVPLGLTLDIPAGKIYWVNGSGGNSLRRCDLNGSNQVTLQTGMNLPYDIGLIPAMPVVLTVTDVNANAATCTGFVNVQDLIVPTISCPSNISANTSLGVCSANVTYATPVGTDNCASTTTQTTGLASGAAFPVGVTTNTFSVADGSGNSATCSFTVTVTDNVAPVITCPSNISTSNGVGTLLASYPLQTNLTDATGNFGAATISGNPTPPAAPTPGNGVCHNGIPVQFPNGQNTVTPNIGTLNPANFTLQVDFKLTGYPGTATGAPVILGGNSWRWLGIWVSQAGQAGVTYNNSNRVYSSTILSLNTWYAGEIRFSANTARLFINHVEVLTVATGALVTNGNLNFTTNHSGNGTALNGCIQNLQIMNGTTPNCGATVYYPTPVGTDNCASTTSRTSGLASGSTFPIGTTTNVFQVTDASGATATCSSTVTVVDTDLPVLTCPSNITVNTASGLCSAVATFSAPVGTDNCPGTTTVQSSGLASGATFLAGTTTNTFTATDAVGNTATCSFTVTIIDNELPTITCPANITGNSDPGLCSKVVTFSAPVGADNCAGPSTSQTAGLASGAAFPVGTTTNVFRVTDAAGNTATCSFTVTISDNQLPTITCPANFTGANDPGLCSKVVTFTAPVGSDNCAGPSTSQTAGLASGAAFPVGTTTNVFRVTDAAGNSATCSFTVIISDNQLPTISCPANITGNNDPGLCSKVVTFTAPVGADNCAGSTTTQTAGLASGAAFPVGTTTNTFRVTDAAGNTATCSFTVSISDNELPTITCPANITGNNDPGLCSKVVTFTAPVGADNCAGPSTSQTAGLASGAAFPVGTTTNVFRVTDAAGNSATCSFMVVISDNQLPTITCPANITGNNDPGLCSKVVTFTAPVGTDNCPSATTTQTAGLSSGAAFPVGTTTNAFLVTDAAGNTATCSFTVVISDNQLPTITCPANITGNNDPGLCSKVVTFTAPVGSDNCAGPSTSQTAGLASGAAFPVGTTTNVFRVTDAAGNSATCSFTVVISDNQLPTISCPVNITGNNDPGFARKL